MKGPHPFPARMAPELALQSVQQVKPGLILDPMCGSGMVLKAAQEAGHRAIGFDVDPLAVLMSAVWTGPALPDLEAAARAVVEQSSRLRSTRLSWIDDDRQTSEFVDYWFASTQQHELRKLARVLHGLGTGAEAEALRLALSRTIVTKSNGASLASDVSHSRPHRTRNDSEYDVYRGFVRATRKISAAINGNTAETALVDRGDARLIDRVADMSVSMVVTSPPYLNAIDYLRGHRLALVWFGWSIGELRSIRSGSVGAERSASQSRVDELTRFLSGQFDLEHLPTRTRGMLLRYLDDLVSVTSEVARVLRGDGQAVFVVGNSVLKGEFIDNSRLTAIAAELSGLRLVDKYERALPPNKRYLPPPSARADGRLIKRMRSEVVLRFAR